MEFLYLVWSYLDWGGTLFHTFHGLGTESLQHFTWLHNELRSLVSGFQIVSAACLSFLRIASVHTEDLASHNTTLMNALRLH